MFLIDCPYCGARDQSEFTYAGEAHRARPDWDDERTDEDWAAWVFMRANVKGVHAERWVHAAGCRRFFNALRNTATDVFLATYPVGEPRPDVEADLPLTPSGEAHGSGNDAVKLVMEGGHVEAEAGDGLPVANAGDDTPLGTKRSEAEGPA
ncbi:MAG: sarcosine oxidase subunit delta [Pseudomonadota bacterium]